MIGFLSSLSPLTSEPLLKAFNAGLQSEGYSHGRNVWIEQRWAEGQYEELKRLASDLVQCQVKVLAATGGVVTAQAAKQVTSTIPIVFIVGYDPVQLGLVKSINAPGGNATGVNIFTTELAMKRLELLKELVGQIRTAGLLVNPGSVTTEIEIRETRAAAENLGVSLEVFAAKDQRELETAFDLAVQSHTSALLVSADPFFNSRRAQIVALAAKWALPTMYPFPAYVEGGGLVSYGTKLTWAYHQIGVYAGRILKGAKPTELPVQLPAEFQLILNLQAAKALGLTVPTSVLIRADRVIE